MNNKQKPWDESVRVPFLLRYPAAFGRAGRTQQAPIDIPDIMPSVLGLCGLQKCPRPCRGTTFLAICTAARIHLTGWLSCSARIHSVSGGPARAAVHFAVCERSATCVRSLEGPWLLYDNEADPYQQDNVLGEPQYDAAWRELEAMLQAQLASRGDEFLPGPAYLERWGYPVGARGTVAYTN